jgi:hypothetical protein
MGKSREVDGVPAGDEKQRSPRQLTIREVAATLDLADVFIPQTVETGNTGRVVYGCIHDCCH